MVKASGLSNKARKNGTNKIMGSLIPNYLDSCFKRKSSICCFFLFGRFAWIGAKQELGNALQPKMQGRQIASCILELVCQPLVRVLTNSILKCGWILLSFNLKNSSESWINSDWPKWLCLGPRPEARFTCSTKSASRLGPSHIPASPKQARFKNNCN